MEQGLARPGDNIRAVNFDNMIKSTMPNGTGGTWRLNSGASILDNLLNLSDLSFREKYDTLYYDSWTIDKKTGNTKDTLIKKSIPAHISSEEMGKIYMRLIKSSNMMRDKRINNHYESSKK